MTEAFLNNKPNCICDNCKIEFYKLPHKIKKCKTHACSKECSNILQTKKIKLNCAECRKEIFKIPAEVLDNNFCSRSCSATFHNRGVRRYEGNLPNCLNCNKLLSESRRKYCSAKCQAEKTKKETWEEIKSGNITNHACIKRHLLEQFGYICNICKTETWCGQKVPLVLDHIDGNSENNNLDNLRLVCGNCDMQLPTYKSKNKDNGRAFRRQRYAEGKSY